MQYPGISRLLFLIVFLSIGLVLPTVPAAVSASTSYRLAAFPFYSQEGSTITLVLTVSGVAPTPTAYEFQFIVRDPSSANWTSNHQRYDTVTGQTEFPIIISYPGPEFPNGASTSLVGTYLVLVNQVSPPVPTNPVQSTVFYVGLTDKTAYQRTETVSIRATGYSPFELVIINIRTATLVYGNTILASDTGVVTDYWYVPRDATTEQSYIVTLQGSTKSDAQGFDVKRAIMGIPSLTSTQSSYQRTETMTFWFQAIYPSGEIANTGLGLLTLTRPDGNSTTLTANYDSFTQTFIATYKTSADNQTGIWSATLAPYGFNDGYGNAGPTIPLSSSPQLQTASLSVSIMTKTTFAPFEQVRFNATIQYPDGTSLQSGSVASTLSFSGGGYTVSIPVIFDTALQLWFGTYTPRGDEPSGLWSLSVNAADPAQPANTGSSTRAIQIQNRPPTAAFQSSSSNTMTNILITFNATTSADSDGTIVSYLWNFGDSSTGSGAISSHAYASAGVYLARLTVTDNGGSTSSANSTITIQNRAPTATITGSSADAFTGASVTFDATASSDPDGTIVGFLWDFGDGSTGSGSTTSHAYTSVGTYTVRLTITDNSGSTASTTYPISITANPSSNNVSFPLYYFGIIAALIAAAMAGAIMAFKRHRVTHAKLRIDLEAVRTEAGRIENQEFFQSVKEQLKKDKND